MSKRIYIETSWSFNKKKNSSCHYFNNGNDLLVTDIFRGRNRQYCQWFIHWFVTFSNCSTGCRRKAVLQSKSAGNDECGLSKFTALYAELLWLNNSEPHTEGINIAVAVDFNSFPSTEHTVQVYFNFKTSTLSSNSILIVLVLYRKLGSTVANRRQSIWLFYSWISYSSHWTAGFM